MRTDRRQQNTDEYAMTAIPSSSHVERTVRHGEVYDCGEKASNLRTILRLLGVAPRTNLNFHGGDGMALEHSISIGDVTDSEHKELCACLVRLTDVFSANFRKANVVKFASRDELGHDACALFEGNTVYDPCRLEQVKFLCPAKLGEDKIDFLFNRCFSVILGIYLQTFGDKGEGQRTGLRMD